MDWVFSISIFCGGTLAWNNSWTHWKGRRRWSRGSMLAFSTQVRGFKPSRSRRIFKGEKILSTPSFGGEVKPSVPCHRFAGCKRSLNGMQVIISANYRTTFSPAVPTSTAGISHVVADVEAPGGEKWEHLKSGGKQWQATPKNLPRMRRTRAIPVAWLNSGLCPDRPKGWIPIIIIKIIIIIIILYYTIQYYTILHYTILYYTILYYSYTIQYYTILYNTILYYTIQYYTVLYYTILYYTIL